MASALSSIRVLDMGTIITAPYAGRILAEFGAEVIKIEQPKGDPFRYFRTDVNPSFAAYNKGKKSVTLDLTQERDKARLHGLLKEADVLLDNFRPGVLTKLGFDPAALAERYPRLIHCSISGFRSPSVGRVAMSAAAKMASIG